MKEQRQSKILSLIQKQEIETQEELAENLEKAGFKVTQATVSRDIRELRLTKVAGKNNAQKYVALANYENQISEKVIRVFKAGFVSMDIAQNILVIRTLTGMGNAVAAAIDAFKHEEIVGTLAGDDTIFCAIRDIEEMESVINKFQEVLNS
ncbi:arginine repressor [Niameybacter massiliensis]|uniref:Arginine repressor n=1 Tax=Holtiella tumoricola TaxID=3018743 RepID=A0AA42J2I9_9FIRM|nr:MULTISPECIES: arginine repressor [Lachnospirales]MDA3733759.1 arginine repressor [Holtiella tumoricola]